MINLNNRESTTDNAVTGTLRIDGLLKNLKKHFHEEYSATVILKGSCRALVDNNDYPMKAGDVLIISPGIIHSCIPACSGTDLSYTAASLGSGLIEKFFMDNGLIRKFKSRSYILISGTPGREKFPASDDMNPGGCNTLSENFLSEILLSASEITNPAVREVTATRRSGPDIAADYLRENYMKDVSLNELAEISGLSKYYLIHRFRKRFGITPYSYMTNLRINSARILLKGNDPLCSIALELGFYDQSHFTNTFINYTGMSPQSYRNFLQ